MAITSSEFYKKLETLEQARQTGIQNLQEQNIDISELASIPDIVNRIPDLHLNPSYPQVTITGGDKIILAGDLPNTYIHLIKDGTLIETKQTPETTGGLVSFSTTDTGNYFVAQSSENVTPILIEPSYTVTNISTNEFTLAEDGYYECDLPYNQNTYVLGRVNFTVPEGCNTVEFDVSQNFQIASDRLSIFSNIDTELTNSNSTGDTANIYAYRYDAIDKVVYRNVTAGTHFIDIKYRKNSNDIEEPFRFRLTAIHNLDYCEKINISNNNTYISVHRKPFKDYTWDEIEIIGNNHYGEYIFPLGCYRYIPFMNSTSSSYWNCFIHLVDFNSVLDINNNPVNMTFMLKNWNTSYKHWEDSSTNANGISWVGSLIRTNCLESGDVQYIYDRDVTSSTSGVYYTYENNQFVQKTLPTDYQSNTKYYALQAIVEDGVFIESLKETNIHPKRVKVNTWTGYGGEVTNNTNAYQDNTIITTQDKVWLPSDSQIFGSNKRYLNYSKYKYEGEQFKLFNLYTEENLYWGSTRWLRSPYVGNSNTFCCWYYSYVTYSTANTTAYCPLCFSI